MYLAGWPRPGDYGLIAEQVAPVGAVWYRTYTEASHGHGFVTEEIPELSIAVIASRRLAGIGRRLLVDLIDASDSQGYEALSLALEANPARRLYESVGFVLLTRIVLDNGPIGWIAVTLSRCSGAGGSLPIDHHDTLDGSEHRHRALQEQDIAACRFG